MKRFVTVMMFVVVILTMGMTALGEATPTDITEVFGSMKVFQTEGELKGRWTIGFQRDENGRYPCALDLGDGRIILVPLTDSEVNALMVKSLEEAKLKAEVEQKEEPSNPNFLARALDWVTFWN